ncbi:hypothetical protein EJ07DRAFT_117554 [Lizonia empirigonia]|nr:hypothetical protein EJ07DRAFT_117554 [Lizonia empirigonia]
MRVKVYICEDVAWGGQCTYTLSPLGSDPSDCTVIPNDRASSIGPDAGFYCIFYTNAFCAPILSDGSDSFGLAYPGCENLGFTKKGDFNDRLLSYQCFRDDDSLHLDPETGLRKVDGMMQ